MNLCVLNSSAGRKACPLCPEEKFKACYSHKLRRHLQNLHWKVYVEFEGRAMKSGPVPLLSVLSRCSGLQIIIEVQLKSNYLYCSSSVEPNQSRTFMTLRLQFNKVKLFFWFCQVKLSQFSWLKLHKSCFSVFHAIIDGTLTDVI